MTLLGERQEITQLDEHSTLASYTVYNIYGTRKSLCYHKTC
jgi:hypothetical protein